MPDMNRISATVSDTDVSDIQAALETIRTKLPFLLTLADSDRQEMAKMGEKSTGFHEKVQGYIATNPEFLPGFMPAAEVAKDQALREQLLKFAPDLKTLARSVDDTLMVVNSELWQSDLAFYQNVRQGAHQGAADAQSLYNDLKTRFPGRSESSAPSNP